MTGPVRIIIHRFRRPLLVAAVFCVCVTASTVVAQEDAPSPAAAPSAAAPEGAPAENGGEAAQQPGFSFRSMIPLYLGLFLLWYLLVQRPSTNQKMRRQELLDNLKKNDKVITIGGVIGTVSSVHESTGEVTIKSSDTPLRVQREAIRDVIDDSAKDDAKNT